MIPLLTGNTNDTVSGGADNDIINTGAGNDILNGDTGDDILIGGMGSDILTGAEGADTFKWSLGDASVDGTNDTVSDFRVSDADVLDLKDLLVGEHSGANANLGNYLTFNQDGNNTVLTIDTNGLASGGDRQTITFTDTNLFSQAGVTIDDSQALITKLIADGNLKTDI